MLLVQSYRSGAMSRAGLMAGYYYDPYPGRFAANLREILGSGARVMVRLHPGTRYPMSEADRIDTVDREGHAVAVVGYDGDEIQLGDPWNPAFGGDDAGLRWTDHRDIAMRWMNASQDMSIVVFPIPVELSATSLGGPIDVIRADVALTAPAPQIRLAADLVSDLTASIRLPEGLELLGSRRQHVANLGAGDKTTFSWEVRETGPVHGQVTVAVAGIATSSDPYPFRDIVGTEAVAVVQRTDVDTATPVSEYA